jgi:hypothetical protein
VPENMKDAMPYFGAHIVGIIVRGQGRESVQHHFASGAKLHLSFLRKQVDSLVSFFVCCIARAECC